jgi:hypothetical protein
MNPTRNNTLLAYLGNYGLSYVGNDNIPNPWTMIPNPYCEYLLHTFTTKVCTHIKPGRKWNYYVVVV